VNNSVTNISRLGTFKWYQFICVCLIYIVLFLNTKSTVNFCHISFANFFLDMLIYSYHVFYALRLSEINVFYLLLFYFVSVLQQSVLCLTWTYLFNISLCCARRCVAPASIPGLSVYKSVSVSIRAFVLHLNVSVFMILCCTCACLSTSALCCTWPCLSTRACAATVRVCLQ
jgi:hypothetical protein